MSLAARGLLAALAAAGMGFAAYLAWLSYSGASVAGCDGAGGFDCDHVLATRWSSWLGVPIAVPAVMVYASVLASVWFLGRGVPRSVLTLAWWIVLALSGAAALAGLWFVGLQWTAIGAFCWPCLATHSCGLLLAAAAWATGHFASRRQGQPSKRSAVVAAAASLAGVGVLIGGQLAYEPPTFRVDSDDSPSVAEASTEGVETTSSEKPNAATETPASPANTSKGPSSAGHATQKPPLSRTLRLHKTSTTLDAYEHPILGSPDAEHVVVKLFDYTCHHCRDQHLQLEEARAKLGQRLAVLVLPVPMNGRCNSFVPVRRDGPHEHACNYARLAVSLWRTDRTKFAEFHHWLFEPETPPPVDAARQRVRELAGEAALALNDNSIEPRNQVEAYTNLYFAVGRGTVPKLVGASFAIDGRFRDSQQLVEVLEEQWSREKR